MGNVQTGNGSGKTKYITRVDKVDDFGDASHRNYTARAVVQPSLHFADLAKHSIICERGVAATMLRHEPKRARILDTAELGAEIAHQSAPYAVGNPFTEIV